MKSLISSLGILAVAGLAVAAPAYADGFRGPGGYGHGAGILRAVGLTDPQREQIRQIMANHRPEFQRLGGELRSAREALTTKLYGPGPVSAADIAPLAQQIDQVRAQLTQQRLQVALEIRNILTPEQVAKAAQVRQRMKELHDEMRSLRSGS